MGWSRYFRRRFWDDERAREIQSYIEIETDENIAKGMSAEEARFAAQRKFGNPTFIREEIYRMNTIGFIESLWQDLRYTFRSLRRNRGFSATAVITLALGIGANTTVFSVVDAVMLRALPYKEPDRLVSISWVGHLAKSDQWNSPRHKGREVEDWRTQKQMFTAVESYSFNYRKVEDTGTFTATRAVNISTGMPELLGVQPKVGRGFMPEEGTPGRDQVALISDGYWAREFGSDPAAVGKRVRLNDRDYTVIGVMPGDFQFPPGYKADAWLPWTARSGESMFYLAARLRPGISMDQAEKEVGQLSDRVHGPDTDSRQKMLPALLPFDNRLNSRFDNQHRTALLAMLGAVAFVFLIACANVANLMLSRGTALQREIAIRAAIGASRGRLLRHFLVESLVLSAAGALSAFLLSWWMTHLIPAILPVSLRTLFTVYESAMTTRVLVFMGGAAVLSCVLSGLPPALSAVRGRMTRGLTETNRVHGSSFAVRRLHVAFQCLQVGLALVLLVGAGLMANSFLRLINTPSGFDTKNLWLAEITDPGFKRAQAFAFYDQLKEGVRMLPGVKSATISRETPAHFGATATRLSLEDAPGRTDAKVQEFFVAPEYFATLGIPIVGGRNFGPGEGPTAPRTGIIDSRCAATFWPGQSPLGKRVRTDADRPWITIVGIAGQVRTWIFDEPNNCQLYEPFSISPMAASLVLRVGGDAGPVLTQVRAVVASFGSKASIGRAATFDELYARTDSSIALTPRFYLILLAIFAGVALATAAVGIYGVVSYSVVQRTSEIGVRMALGATARDIRHLMIRTVLFPLSVGIIGGIMASLWLARVLHAILYKVTPHDPVTFMAVAIFISVVALAASYLPSRRATRIDPMVALRIE